MILFGSLVQVKGSGFALVSSTKRWMASLICCRDRKTPRLSRFFARLAKKPSTALSHEADVWVKWKMKRGGVAVCHCCFKLAALGGAQPGVPSLVHSSDSHTRVRQGILKRIETSDLVH